VVTVTHGGDVISTQTCANRYTITRTYQAADVCGNTATCTFTVTVQDTQAPTVTCPSNITVVESPPSSGSATVTYTDYDPTTGFTPVDPVLTSSLVYSSAFEVPKFNPALGTLTKVSWYIWVEFTGSVGLVNNGSDPQSGTLNFGTQHTVDVASLGVNEITQPIAAGGPFAYSLAGGGGADSVGPSSGWDDDSGFTTSPAVLANWTGAGNVSLPLVHESVLLLIGGGSLLADFEQQGRSYIDVTYTYTPGVVPEPGTYVGGLALVGVGALAYRRMRRA